MQDKSEGSLQNFLPIPLQFAATLQKDLRSSALKTEWAVVMILSAIGQTIFRLDNLTMQPEFASSGEELEFVDVAATLSLHVVGAHGLPYAGITMIPFITVNFQRQTP